MEAPFRVGETPAYIFIDDVNGTKLCLMYVKGSVNDRVIRQRADKLCELLNNNPLHMADL